MFYLVVVLTTSSFAACGRQQICVQAALYQTEFRPVPLEEYIKVGNNIYNKSMDIMRTISKGADLGGKDPDHIVELCNEVGIPCFLLF